MPVLLHPGKVIVLAHGANPATWSNPMSADYSSLVTEFLALVRSVIGSAFDGGGGGAVRQWMNHEMTAHQTSTKNVAKM